MALRQRNTQRIFGFGTMLIHLTVTSEEYKRSMPLEKKVLEHSLLDKKALTKASGQRREKKKERM